MNVLCKFAGAFGLVAASFVCSAEPAARERVITVRSGIVYSPAQWSTELAADLYRPVTCLPCPVVVLVHGGGWTTGRRAQMSGLARGIAAHGHAALAIDYRLAPAATHPAAVDDVQQALRWLRTQGRRLGLDPDRIILWGYSAGAQLATLAAQRDGGTEIRGVVAGGLPADLRQMGDSAAVQAYLGGTAAAFPERYADASVLLQVSPRMPPVFLYHALQDEVVAFDQARRMKAALVAAGVCAELHAIESGDHAAASRLPDRDLRAHVLRFVSALFDDRGDSGVEAPPSHGATARSICPQIHAP
jgi:acetyl esterase/lipase